MRYRLILLHLLVILLVTACGQKRTLRNENASEIVTYNQELEQTNRELRKRLAELDERYNASQERVSTLRNRIESLERKSATVGPTNVTGQDALDFSPDKATLHVAQPFGAVLTDSDSMRPVMDEDTMLVQIPPEQREIRPGDIIAFTANYSATIIVHRVIAVGKDDEGWFAITKGDNNVKPDPEKVRRDDLIGITAATVY